MKTCGPNSVKELEILKSNSMWFIVKLCRTVSVLGKDLRRSVVDLSWRKPKWLEWIWLPLNIFFANDSRRCRPMIWSWQIEVKQPSLEVRSRSFLKQFLKYYQVQRIYFWQCFFRVLRGCLILVYVGSGNLIIS